jgi:hypothetical protein
MVMGLFIAKYGMRYSDIRLDEQLLKLHDGRMVKENPGLRQVEDITRASKFSICRGMAFRTKANQSWKIAVWPSDYMTHNDFYRTLLKTGYEITEDIGVFFAFDEETAGRDAMGTLTFAKSGSIVYGYYPAGEWAGQVLRDNFPRLFLPLTSPVIGK